MRGFRSTARIVGTVAVLGNALIGTNDAVGFDAPNIIIKVKGGAATITNNKESEGCTTGTCKYVLHSHERLTVKAKPAVGYKFKRWEGPCISTKGYKCTIEGSNKTEHFVARVQKGRLSPS